MQSHPFSVTSFVCSGKGGGSGYDETKKNTIGLSSLINLELEVGCGLVDKSNFVFTDDQFQELYLQVIIFKYLSSGLSVPFDLVLPVWNSFAISSGSGFCPPLFVQERTMDLEPGRCRRTDGKKWRCYGSVVPDQKYCERHMHRGSQRSRKLVEASKNILESSNNEEDLLSDKKPRSSIFYPVSTTLNLTTPSATAKTGFECSSSTAIISSLLKAQAVKTNNPRNNPRNASNWNDSLGNNNSGKSSSCIGAGFGVSPKSVLHGDNNNTGNRNLSSGTQNDALRCRRTDGKRWRCSRMVVPCKKYCEKHLHRGSKKGAKGMAAAVVGASCVQKKAEMVVKNYRVLDTNLSISIAPNPRQNLENDSCSSSSSDATTVSDENVLHFHTL